MFVGDNHILAQIEADEFEKEIIIESKDKNEDYNGNRE